MVEIAKALSFNAKILVMDEPTAALTETEIQTLFTIINQLKRNGVGIIYISHRMEELKLISDRITILRDGQYIDTLNTKETEISKVISLMVGRELYMESKEREITNGSVNSLEVRNLTNNHVKDINFTLKKGEILGFAGLVGAGRTEVARAVFGADPIQHGEILIDGKQVNIKQPSDAVRVGIGYLSEDRKQFGLMVNMNVTDNIMISTLKSHIKGRDVKDSNLRKIRSEERRVGKEYREMRVTYE